ncbi:minichromosome maintenance protein MCM [Candidatus Woesearchaeota archaeon]|jgi:replicative DNA helicase Mcm|nr:minichromosome maintenance protein MCM [Candidatus Woesearchaeota archaeon]
MKTSDVVSCWENFIENNCLEALENQIRLKNFWMNINFNKIMKFEPEFANYILDNFQTSLEIGELIILKKYNLLEFEVRLVNLPKSCEINISELRSENLDKLIVLEGIIKQKSNVRPKLVASKKECSLCRNIIVFEYFGEKLKFFKKCSCGNNGFLREISSKLIDEQLLLLEESLETFKGFAPKQIKLILEKDLTSHLLDMNSPPGSKIKVVGEVRKVPIISRDREKLAHFDTLIKVNSFEILTENFFDVLKPEERELFIKKSKELNFEKKLIESFAPGIYGHENVKKALMLCLVGGSKDKFSRNDLNLLVSGEPGIGKSCLAKFFKKISPKCRIASGESSSGVGLTATVLRDELTGGWTIQAGLLPLCNNGHVVLDEIDKLRPEELQSLQSALASQEIHISKATVSGTLPCKVGVFAICNPKEGYFDKDNSLFEQLNINSTLLDRFDLIFFLKDIPSSNDKKIAETIISREKSTPCFDELFLKKYLLFCTSHKIKWTDELNEFSKKLYQKIRNASYQKSNLRANPRTFESLRRLSTANAKLRLAEFVSKDDVMTAFYLLNSCFNFIDEANSNNIVEEEEVL